MTADATVKVLLYVLYHKHDRYLDDCLKSIRQNLSEFFFDVKFYDTAKDDSDRSTLKERVNNEFEVIKFPSSLPAAIDHVYETNLHLYDFIIRLDADDFLYPTALKTLTNHLLENKETCAVYGNWTVVSEENRLISNIKSPAPTVGDGFHGACTMFRCNSLKGLEFAKIQIDSQDGLATYLHLEKTRAKIARLDVNIFYYRRHSSNLSNNEERLWKNRTKIIDYFSRATISKTQKSLHVFVVGPLAKQFSLGDLEFLRSFKHFNHLDKVKSSAEGKIFGDQNKLVERINYEYPNTTSACVINPTKLANFYKKNFLQNFIKFYSLGPGIDLHAAEITERLCWKSTDSSLTRLNKNDGYSEFIYMKTPGVVVFSDITNKRGEQPIRLFTNNYLTSPLLEH